MTAASAAKRSFLHTARALAGLALFGCLCNPGPQIPLDGCSNPTTGMVDTVEIAATRVDPNDFGFAQAKDALPPRALAANDVLWIIRGGQGSNMVGVRLVLRGPDAPSCIAQDTKVTVDGSEAARNRENFNTYPLEGGGGRATKTVWMPGAFSSLATVATTAAGKQATLSVVTVTTSECAGVGCPCANALSCNCTDGITDAGRTLWNALEACRRCDGGICSCDTQERACQGDLF